MQTVHYKVRSRQETNLLAGVSLAQINKLKADPDIVILKIEPGIAVSPRQLRLALLKLGITPADVEATINQLDEPQRTAALIEWEYALEIKRDHPLIATLAATWNQTDAEVDALFLAASELT